MKWLARSSCGAAVAMVAILLGSSIPPGAGAAGPIAAARWSTGDVAEYSGAVQLSFTVGAPVDILGRDGRVVSTFGVQSEVDDSWNQTDFVGEVSGAIEVSEVPCPTRGDGGCYPTTMHAWRFQGTPAVLGASLLQGRSFHVGDSWSESSACAACVGEISVTIGAPWDESPAGTDYVAVIRGDYRFGAAGWWSPSGALHMSAQHSFPLRADLSDGTYVLTRLVAGGGPPVPATHGTRSMSSPLTAVSFSDGRPVEGTLPGGHPSWAASRQQSGAPSVAGQFVGADYATGRAWFEVGTRDVETKATWTWTERYALAEGAGFDVTIERTRSLPALGLEAFDRTTWRSAPGEPRVHGECTDEAVPIWDLASAVVETGLIAEATGYSIRSDWSPCETFLLTVFGATYRPEGALVAESEMVSVEMRTGALDLAVTLT